MSGSLENIAWDQRLARILVRPLARTSVHPNAITTLGLMMGLLAGYLFAQGDPVLANWAAGVFMFAAFVDHADGELARLVNKTSTFGHYYDHVAAAVAAKLGAIRLVFVSNVPGVLIADRVVRAVTADQVEGWIADGNVFGGMVPKVRSAIEAVRQGVAQAVITNIAGVLEESGTGIIGNK